MSEASSLLTGGFTPNPMYNKLDSIVGEGYAELLQDIVDQAQNLGYDLGDFGNDFPEELIEQLMSQFDQQLDAVIDTFEATPTVEPYMPPAPNHAVLYNRVSVDQPTLDLGSGDGRKAEKAKIADITLSDVVIPKGNYSRKWVKLDAMCKDEMDRHLHNDDYITTSLMSLTQMPSLKTVECYDGIHLVPDMEYLKGYGAISLGGGKYRMAFKGRVFDDHDHGLNGYKVSNGYIGYCTFRTRKLYIELDGTAFRMRPPELPTILDAPFNVDPKATPKYDGTQIFFDIRKDGGIAVNRAGMARSIIHNFPFEAQFCAEYLKSGVYVLIRIMRYHNFVPWHDVSILKKFCENVNIDIAGDKLLYPGHELLSKAPTDGIIMRMNEMDFRVKGLVTVDLDEEAWARFVFYFEQNSSAFTIDVVPSGTEITEYLFKMENGVYAFSKIRMRTDKTEVTDIGTFMYLADLC